MKLSVAVLLTVAAYAAAYLDITPIPGGLSGSGNTTRTWDCCKPSCSWLDNLNSTSATTPVRSCLVDGKTTADIDAESGCVNGTAFACTDQQPQVYNDTISLGFVGASFTAGIDVSKCCSCVLLSFKDQIEGKHMAVQITNTGGSLGRNHFDMSMPGGGVGTFPTGCSSQWNAPVDGWGDRYGGVHTIEECDELPEQLQPGCKWRFEWFEGADNPTVDFYEIECPQQLLDISGCQ